MWEVFDIWCLKRSLGVHVIDRSMFERVHHCFKVVCKHEEDGQRKTHEKKNKSEARGRVDLRGDVLRE